MKAQSNSTGTAGFIFSTYGASLIVVLIGLLGLAGWTFGIGTFKNVLRSFPTMVPNTALAFLLSGCSLWFQRTEKGATRYIGQLCAFCVALIGTIILCEFLFHWNPGFDQWLYKDALKEFKAELPGRPTLLTALNFVLLGTGLLLLDHPLRSGIKLSEGLTVTALLVTLLALVGYICHVSVFYGWRSAYPNSGMALNTMIAFLVLGIGVLCARPSGGLMEILTSRTASGSMARRLILAPVIIPLATGWLQSVAQKKGFHNPEFAMWLFAFLNLFVFTFIIWWNARLIFRSESIRQKTDDELHELNAQLEQRVNERTAEVSEALEILKASEEKVRKLNEELEQRVRDRTAALENLNRELEAFSYSVSHDLRAPLRHIDGFVGMLKSSVGDTLPAECNRYLNTISHSAKHMGTLIENLLAFSRMARTEIRDELVDLQQLADETINSLRIETRERNISWKKGSLPKVHGDRSMLRQVFVNLVSNAVKYTRPRDPAEIEIGCTPQTTDEIVVFVRDNGVGFDMKYASKLFGVFQRLHLEEDFEGTGIGLANVRRIIGRHHGRTWAESELNQGATFYFSLPKNNHHNQ